MRVWIELWLKRATRFRADEGGSLAMHSHQLKLEAGCERFIKSRVGLETLLKFWSGPNLIADEAQEGAYVQESNL